MKQNLYDWFSHYDVEKNSMPKIESSDIDQNAVRERVFAKLDLPQPATHVTRTHFRLTKLTAAATAAVILIAGGTLVTTAAGFGGFRQLSDVIFGKTSEYPEMMEEYYTVPEAEITNTCENIESRVVGMVGDSKTVYISIEFTATGGLAFSEETYLTGDYGSCWIQKEGCDDAITLPYSTQTAYIDETHISKTFLFQSEPYFIDDLQQDNLTFIFQSGHFLSQNPDKYRYTETTLKRWLGYSNAEINKGGALTAEDMQKVRDNFVTDDKTYYYPKELLIDSGRIDVTFPFQYPETKTENYSYTYEKADINLQLSALAASFSWSKNDIIPSVFEDDLPTFLGDIEETLHAGNMLAVGMNGDSYAVMNDGTKVKGTSNGELNLLNYSNYASREVCPDSIDDKTYQTVVETQQYDSYLKITFTQPVDPSQIKEIYYNDSCIWQRS